MPGKVPDRWEDYSNIGKVIPNTRFIALKVPLGGDFTAKLSDPSLAFTPHDLITYLQDKSLTLGLIVDLTNTRRYYKPQQTLARKNVEHVKIFTEGHVVPSREVQHQFAKAVKSFIEASPDSDSLIGVHCTHGVNRTGYLVCRYMVSEMGIKADDAIQAFNESRGHLIERENYLEDLRSESHPMYDEQYESPPPENQPSNHHKNRHRNRNRHRSRNWQSEGESTEFRDSYGSYDEREDDYQYSQHAQQPWHNYREGNYYSSRQDYNEYDGYYDFQHSSSSSRHPPSQFNAYNYRGSSAPYNYNDRSYSNGRHNNQNSHSQRHWQRPMRR